MNSGVSVDAKTYLEQISQVSLAIKSKAEQIEALEAMSVKTSPTLDGMPTPILHKSMLEECVTRITDIKGQLADDQKKLLDLYLEAKEMIDNLKDTRQRVVLEQRYILGKPCKEIYLFMGISSSTYEGLHSSAMQKISEILAQKR
ncbi:MAG: DUF1492 domain-containing protein [Chloroflexi bacterium]|nr:DUF1492 domain-containing protein [Chloroflexota bacterium]